jgi:hypothetical protein
MLNITKKWNTENSKIQGFSAALKPSIKYNTHPKGTKVPQEQGPRIEA